MCKSQRPYVDAAHNGSLPTAEPSRTERLCVLPRQRRKGNRDTDSNPRMRHKLHKSARGSPCVTFVRYWQITLKQVLPPPHVSDPKGPESLSKELRKNWEKKFNSNSGLEYLGANNINWLETGFVNYSHPKTCFFLWEARNSWDLTEALHTTGKEGFPVKNEKGQWETHNNDAFWLQPKSLVCFGVHS